MLGCVDLRKIIGGSECCSSCHEDAEEYGDYMCFVEHDGYGYEVCCRVANDYDKWVKSTNV